MRHQSFRTMTILAVATLAGAAACANATLPVPARSTATASTASPSTITAPTSSEPSRLATEPPACLGAVYYTLDTAVAVPHWPKLCISIGGVLRLANEGPGGVSRSPADKVSCFYAGGVHECRLIKTGTIQFTLVKPYGTRVLHLVVTGSSPGPAPACVPADGTHVVNVQEGGPPWSAICMKLGAVLRLENHGPGNFTAEPATAVSCWYEAGIRECRFMRAATVTFTVTLAQEIRTLTSVAIR